MEAGNVQQDAAKTVRQETMRDCKYMACVIWRRRGPARVTAAFYLHPSQGFGIHTAAL